MNENWKIIKDFEEYEVSDLGQVRKGNYILKQEDYTHGYKRVMMKDKEGKRKHYRVHQLVANAFLENPNPEIYIDIDHKDGNKANNAVSNLEWVTHKENVERAYSLKGRAKSLPLKAINKETGEILYFLTMGNAENYVRSFRPGTNTPRTSINDNCKGKTKSAYGHIWEKVEEIPEDAPIWEDSSK